MTNDGKIHTHQFNKLNIGCCLWPMKGYTNIDNGYDYHTNRGSFKLGFLYMKEQAPHEMELVDGKDYEFLEMDGNKMTFDDESFDEVFSNQCVGVYVTDFEGIIRVLKYGGRISLGVWKHKLAYVIGHLLQRNIQIVNVSWLNGSYEDIDEREGIFTVMIEGIKVREQKGYWRWQNE